MDQSLSNNPSTAYALPKRSLSVEFFVGIFTILTLACTAYLAVGLGGVSLFGNSTYDVYAQFDNVSGLKSGAAVEVGGVPVGSVTNIELDDPRAKITLSLHNSFKLRDDDIASIRTKGIIGDRYVKISRGASETFIPEKGLLLDTESVVDIEDIIGKLVHSFSGDKDEKEKDK